MNETIRERLKRRARWCLVFAFGGFLFFMLTPAVYGTGRMAHIPVLPFVGVAMVFLGMLAMQRMIKCPKCDSRLGQDLSFRLGFSLFRKPPNFCPFCGISLDEPWP
jgi:hypothetical protein